MMPALNHSLPPSSAASLLVAGLRYQTATLDLREQVAFNDSELAEALAFLKTQPGVAECALLTTCNRTEAYVWTRSPETALASVQALLNQFKGFNWQTHRANTFTYLGQDAVRHLYEVACGLDSLILGEGQIMGQLKETLKLAQTGQTLGPQLDYLLKSALTVGKRVRSQTGISSRDASVSKAAYQLALEQCPGFPNVPLAVMGGGKMAEILLENLAHDLPREAREQVTIINRSPHRLDTLCERFGFKGRTWDGIAPVLQTARVLFVATGAPHTVLDETSFSDNGVALGATTPRLLIDISVPRNIDPSLAGQPGITLVNTDDLAGYQGVDGEAQDRLKAEARLLIGEAYQAYTQWQAQQPAEALVARLRHQLEALRQEELSHYKDPTHVAVAEQATRALLNKLLHTPTVRLKQAPEALASAQQWLAYLFELAENVPDSNQNHLAGEPAVELLLPEASLC